MRIRYEGVNITKHSTDLLSQSMETMSKTRYVLASPYRGQHRCNYCFNISTHLYTTALVQLVSPVQRGTGCVDLPCIVKYTTSIVSRLWRKFQETQSIADRPRQGRPRKTTPDQDRLHAYTHGKLNCVDAALVPLQTTVRIRLSSYGKRFPVARSNGRNKAQLTLSRSHRHADSYSIAADTTLRTVEIIQHRNSTWTRKSIFPGALYEDKVPLHAENTIRNQWIVACRRADKFNPNTSRICSRHFKSDDFELDFRAQLLDIPVKRPRILKPTARVIKRADITLLVSDFDISGTIDVSDTNISSNSEMVSVSNYSIPSECQTVTIVDSSPSGSSFQTVPQCEEDGLQYIAGYVASKFKDKYPDLGDYTHKLQATHDYCIPSWVQHLSFGGLVKPSDKWMNNFHKIEKHFIEFHGNEVQRGENVLKGLLNMYQDILVTFPLMLFTLV
ncbi:hypothetical protein ANN_04258 [Periplaneta americana]|uniref:THAP-type domain-containing protein n=1 Tax=Periplaneta americana TaxID=6978 RepID=A0ABQ8T9M3_PERAM|nr:hypothetical protein ANN_04258 [Periplaneta americana]